MIALLRIPPLLALLVIPTLVTAQDDVPRKWVFGVEGGIAGQQPHMFDDVSRALIGNQLKAPCPNRLGVAAALAAGHRVRICRIACRH